jgi:hypothetical protein
MELQAFIKSTLLEIMGGIRDAQKAWHDETGGAGAINPAWGGAKAENIKSVSFDVAVTVGTGSQGEAGGGIKVLGVGFGAKLNDTSTNSSVSRIQFEVPIIAPVVEVEQTWTALPKTGIRVP